MKKLLEKFINWWIAGLPTEAPKPKRLKYKKVKRLRLRKY